MNTLKITLALLFGVAFGLGLNQIVQAENILGDQTNYESYNQSSFCHLEENSFSHMLETLTLEEQEKVSQKIDELLIKYDVTEETVYQDSDIHEAFMDELMTFFDEEGIAYPYNNHYNDYHYNGHMGMH